MIVVTISKWRQKVAWLLAAILVAAVLLGQLVRSERSHLATPGIPAGDNQAVTEQQGKPVAAPAAGDKGYLEGLIEKLRSFYRGE
ncbi:MAG: hypothetical protein PWQ18_1003 [Clostridia bacterium]|nr:hypothetical protein [Clostridia bacterium]